MSMSLCPKRPDSLSTEPAVVLILGHLSPLPPRCWQIMRQHIQSLLFRPLHDVITYKSLTQPNRHRNYSRGPGSTKQKCVFETSLPVQPFQLFIHLWALSSARVCLRFGSLIRSIEQGLGPPFLSPANCPRLSLSPAEYPGLHLVAKRTYFA